MATFTAMIAHVMTGARRCGMVSRMGIKRASRDCAARLHPQRTRVKAPANVAPGPRLRRARTCGRGRPASDDGADDSTVGAQRGAGDRRRETGGSSLCSFPDHTMPLRPPGRDAAETYVAEAAQRGNAAAMPPSTGKVAPVVGVWLEAKKTTARPTCAPVTSARNR